MGGEDVRLMGDEDVLCGGDGERLLMELSKLKLLSPRERSNVF